MSARSTSAFQLTPQSLPWISPLELASSIDEPWWVLLYSGVQAGYSGRYSYLACELAERVEGENFSGLQEKLSAGGERLGNSWFGYLGYGLKNSLEGLEHDRPGWLPLPALCMMRFARIYCFDHEKQELTCWSTGAQREILPKAPLKLPAAGMLRSNMTRAQYLKKAAQVIEAIHRGDLYQANLTRKFMGEFDEAPDGFSLFRRLCEVSPAPYSAFLKLGERCVLSSSPEMFLRIDADGQMQVRPVKGTSPRCADAQQDEASRAALESSAKDRAENLMIVDLMRNDLSKTSVPGSVRTQRLFEVTSHAQVHHMSSTVISQKRPECSALDAVKHCFPPGSMTGAPKIRAMNLCSAMEGLERGVYSGALGWFGGDGSCELSVVIRTLLLEGRKFEFQVGGGIVADSTPEKEYRETIDKSKGILKALGLDEGYIPE